jgi:gas vesicle protein
MNETEKPWNERLMESLRQTGESIRNEAQKLMSEINDPANGDKVKQRLAEMGDWAKKTAEDAAGVVDQTAKKVEEAISAAAAKARAGVRKPAKKAAKSAKRGAKKKKARSTR